MVNWEMHYQKQVNVTTGIYGGSILSLTATVAESRKGCRFAVKQEEIHTVVYVQVSDSGKGAY